MLTNLRQFFAGFRPEITSRPRNPRICVSSPLCIPLAKVGAKKFAVIEIMCDRNYLTNNNVRNDRHWEYETKRQSRILHCVLSWSLNLFPLEEINISLWTSHAFMGIYTSSVKIFGSSYRFNASRSGTPTSYDNSEEIQLALILQPSAFARISKNDESFHVMQCR